METLVKDVIVRLSRDLDLDPFKSLRASSRFFCETLDKEYEQRILTLPCPTDYFLRNNLISFMEKNPVKHPSIESLNTAMKRGYIHAVRKCWILFNCPENEDNAGRFASEILISISMYNTDNNPDYYELFSYVSQTIVKQRPVLFWKCVKKATRNGNSMMVKNLHRIYLEGKKQGLVSAIQEAIKADQLTIVKYFMSEGWEFIERSTETRKLLELALDVSIRIFKLIYEESKTIDIYADDSKRLAIEAFKRDKIEVVVYLIKDQNLEYLLEEIGALVESR